jgi:hypothetical protein
MMLPGLMSRCTSPARCTAESAEATATPTASVSVTESRFLSAMRRSSEIPATYSIARPITPRASSMGSA